MKKQVVEITIKKDGSFALEAKEGFSGQNCREQTKDLELMLGGEMDSTENTQAFYDDDGDNGLSLDLNL